MNRAITAATIAALTAGAGLMTVAPPASAATDVGVAPSPTGYVMVGVPTQIAASGFSGTGKVYRYDQESHKWSLLGTVMKGKALPYTFLEPGVTKLRVVPARGRARTVAIGVYEKYYFGDKTPTNYGGTVLASVRHGHGNESIPLKSQAGCVLLDAGANNTTEHEFDLQVVSTGAPEYNVHIGTPVSIISPSIPIAGDSVVTIKGSENPWGYADFHVGFVVTCLSSPTDS